ncbi:hypothetical protein G6F40_016609 [Rhizopus arrhizus]|nr:hypothetical protein G6F40_016609 [Rhizopus arrhizus]
MRARRPDVPLAISALSAPERRRELEKLGTLVFTDPSAAIRTIGAVAGLAAQPAADPDQAIPSEQTTAPRLASYYEVQAMDVLRQAGLPVTDCTLAADADAAARAAAGMATWAA